jgi:tRNA(Ile)-lysidine synthase
MLKRLSQDLRAEGLLDQGALVIVGVSGGADSMALLYLLHGLNKQFGWQLKLHVAHLNHNLRGGEAEKDAAFVQAAADHLSLPCTIETRDVGELVESASGGIEEIGRRERYVFFERVALRVGAKVVAVGHHLDDNAETILHRILRGTGLRGLVGISKDRAISPLSEVRLVRPLLRLPGSSLRQYLADQGVAFREDRSNQLSEPMRNYLRNQLIPRIEADVNPQVKDALVRLGEQANWLEEFLRETVHRTFETLIISHTDQVLTLNADALARKSRIVQTELVRLAYRSFRLGEQDLSFAHLVAALELVAGDASGKRIELPGGMTIEKRYHQLIFSLLTQEPREMIAAEIAVHLPGRTVLPIRRLEIDCRIDDVVEQDIARLRRNRNQFAECVDLDAVRPPLVVRTRRSGDRFVPLGAPGSKKLSDFLIDSKVDAATRDQVAVLCDQLGPIWIIGHRIDDRVKITALTRRVLHIHARSFEA